MKEKKLLKGNHALVEGAISGGCKYFFGYPITPQSEVMEWFSQRMEETGGHFLQAESEVAAMNMVIGAAVSGGSVMTASSGPGMDLFQEGIGNIHAHQLPVVIADIMRGGPGNGALHPAQQDYTQAINGGRADQRNIVFAPWNAQEMYDHAQQAFELADKYRNIVMILADNIVGQSYETVTVDDAVRKTPAPKDWILTGAKGRERRLSIAHFPFVEGYDRFHRQLQEKYRTIAQNEQRSETYFIDDQTELVVVAYGIVARNALSAITRLREQNVPVGLFRPVTLFPFPVKALSQALSGKRKMLVVEMSAGQMASDIRSQLTIDRWDLKPGQATAEVPKPAQIENWIKESLENLK